MTVDGQRLAQVLANLLSNAIKFSPDNSVVLAPEGYHPVGAPHGYELYYLNVMAGPSRNWVFHNDPQHAWIVQK